MRPRRRSSARWGFRAEPSRVQLRTGPAIVAAATAGAGLALPGSGGAPKKDAMSASLGWEGRHLLGVDGFAMEEAELMNEGWASETEEALAAAETAAALEEEEEAEEEEEEAA